MTSRCLNLGCGTDIRPGWTHLDAVALAGVDVVHDLNQVPLPFADESFDEILCVDVLEHVELVPLLREIHRLLAPGGQVRFQVPHFTSNNNWADPTHRNRFSIKTLQFFVRGTFEHTLRGRHMFDFAFGSQLASRITFQQGWPFFWNGLIRRVVNRSYRLQCYYEATGLAYLFPAENIRYTLIK
jgi:SAM-dependent methyltransferase